MKRSLNIIVAALVRFAMAGEEAWASTPAGLTRDRHEPNLSSVPPEAVGATRTDPQLTARIPQQPSVDAPAGRWKGGCSPASSNDCSARRFSRFPTVVLTWICDGIGLCGWNVRYAA